MASSLSTIVPQELPDTPTLADNADHDGNGVQISQTPPNHHGTVSSATSISNPALEVDSNNSAFSDTDSAITDLRTLSSTQSARSSIFDFVEDQGRTFHKYKEGKYVLPNDAQEQDRLDLQHHLLLVLLQNRLHLAPIAPNPQNVLDVGTGTGIWAIEFAIQNPSANVIGSDLSPIQPEFVPSNCQFEIDDAEDEWVYSQRFDLIHMRGLMTCFTNPRSVLEKSFNHLVPGGYLEMQDGVFPMLCRDQTLAGTALDKWGKKCVEAGIKVGREWTNAVHYKRWMEEIGFEDVKEKVFEVATSPWPKGVRQKELGMWFQADLLDVLSSSLPLFTRVLGWTREEIELLLVDARNDVKNKGIHSYMPM
jgi:ubiquinone/menaquinone biosynthesis C-methylase UbiE